MVLSTNLRVRAQLPGEHWYLEGDCGGMDFCFYVVKPLIVPESGLLVRHGKPKLFGNERGLQEP